MSASTSSRSATARSNVDPRSRGLLATKEQLDLAVQAALAQRRPVLYPFQGEPSFTDEERAAINQGGGMLEARDLGIDDPMLQATAEYAAIVASALSTAEVAKVLRVSPGRVCQRLQARSLLGITTSRGWRVPSFQFVDSGEMSGWSAVARALPEGVSLTGVLRWLLQRHCDLVVGEDELPLSPRAWLLSGRDPEAVVALTADFDLP